MNYSKCILCIFRQSWSNKKLYLSNYHLNNGTLDVKGLMVFDQQQCYSLSIICYHFKLQDIYHYMECKSCLILKMRNSKVHKIWLAHHNIAQLYLVHLSDHLLLKPFFSLVYLDFYKLNYLMYHLNFPSFILHQHYNYTL